MGDGRDRTVATGHYYQIFSRGECKHLLLQTVEVRENHIPGDSSREGDDVQKMCDFLSQASSSLWIDKKQAVHNL